MRIPDHTKASSAEHRPGYSSISLKSGTSTKSATRWVRCCSPRAGRTRRRPGEGVATLPGRSIAWSRRSIPTTPELRREIYPPVFGRLDIDIAADAKPLSPPRRDNASGGLEAARPADFADDESVSCPVVV